MKRGRPKNNEPKTLSAICKICGKKFTYLKRGDFYRKLTCNNHPAHDRLKIGYQFKNNL